MAGDARPDSFKAREIDRNHSMNVCNLRTKSAGGPDGFAKPAGVTAP